MIRTEDKNKREIRHFDKKKKNDDNRTRSTKKKRRQIKVTR